jgi:uncharacterized protein (TIGR04222 family)
VAARLAMIVIIAAAVFGVLALAWRRRDRADRAAAATMESIVIDPWHAAVTQGTTKSLTQAAAAELISSGQIRLDDDVLVHSVDAPDVAPTHPLVTALLDAVRRRQRPARLADVHDDEQLQHQYAVFVAEQDARVPRMAARSSDTVATAAEVAAAVLAFPLAVQIMVVVLGRTDTVPLIGACLAGVVASWAAAVVLMGDWPLRRDHFSAHCRTQPAPAAWAASSEEEKRRIGASLAFLFPEDTGTTPHRNNGPVGPFDADVG